MVQPQAVPVCVVVDFAQQVDLFTVCACLGPNALGCDGKGQANSSKHEEPATKRTKDALMYKWPHQQLLFSFKDQTRRAKTTAAEDPQPTVQHQARKSQPSWPPAKAADSSR